MKHGSVYSEKLKSPKWQKKRLKIMERDNFTCRICGNKDETLNVHHICYDGGEPWDTDDELLITLCETCHNNEHNNDHVYRGILDMRNNGITAFEIKTIASIMAGFINAEPNMFVKIVDYMMAETGCQVLSKHKYDSLRSIADMRVIHKGIQME